MQTKIKNSVRRFLPAHRRPYPVLYPEDVAEARVYIQQYWQKLERLNQSDAGSLIGLPKPYLIPAYEEGQSFDFNELYYWDSYFMVQGMLNLQNKMQVLGILENLIHLYERFGIIPNASRTYLSGRSQPPLLTSFIMDVYEAYELDKQWLKRHMDVAMSEYYTVWMGARKPNHRLVYRGLSRYYDINHLDDLAEAESGWDMTPRFNRKALNFIPIDLNCLLYKYEADFAKYATIIGDNKAAAMWQKAADKRAKTINELMWDSGKNMYFDYNYVKQKRGRVASLATFYPMWCGMMSEEHAAGLVKNVARFEHSGGLTTTDKPTMNQKKPNAMPMQWAYPNGWAPLHYIVIKGLERYGYHETANRIAMKWLHTNMEWFNANREFLEKYNVVHPHRPPASGVYPSQTGFGWTNAIFERLCQDYIDTSKN